MSRPRSGNAPSLVIAWSGHRKDLDEPKVLAAAKQVLVDLRTRLSVPDDQPSPFVGIGSIAIGADTVIAEALKDTHSPLILHLPFDRSRFEPGATPAQLARIDGLLSAAKVVNICPPQPNDDQAYLDAGIRTVENADVLIAVWDRKPANGVGGTAQIVGIAEKLHIPTIKIDPVSGEVEWPPEPWPESPWATSDPHQPTPILRTREDVTKHFIHLDELAQRHAKPSRNALFFTILLHLIATAVAIFAAIVFVEHGDHAESAAHLDAKPFWTIVLVATIAAGVIKIGFLIAALIIGTTYRPSHLRWLNARAAAELCRSFLALWEMPRDIITLPPAPTFATGPLRRELELAWLLDAQSSPNLSAVRTRYVAGQTGDPANERGRLNGQLRYFLREKGKARNIGHRSERIGKIATYAAIVLTGITLAMVYYHLDTGGWKHVYHMCKAVSIILPLVTATALTFATARDVTRRTARFDEMARRVEALKLRVEAAENWPALGRAVTDSEWLLQSELAEWHAFTRYAGELHS